MLISVITVCYNAINCIESSLISVRDQTHSELEHLVIDGGSNDGTAELLHRYRDGLGYWVSEPDEGIYSAMNKGIVAASGDVVFFLNADDRFADNETVADVADAFIRDNTVDIVYGNQIWSTHGQLRRVRQPRQITRRYLARNTVYHQSIFSKRTVFESTGLFSEQYDVVSDYEWVLKVFLNSRFTKRYLDRDIAIVSVDGRSSKRDWESERIDVMRAVFSNREILIYRTIPEKVRLLGLNRKRLANLVGFRGRQKPNEGR